MECPTVAHIHLQQASPVDKSDILQLHQPEETLENVDENLEEKPKETEDLSDKLPTESMKSLEIETNMLKVSTQGSPKDKNPFLFFDNSPTHSDRVKTLLGESMFSSPSPNKQGGKKKKKKKKSSREGDTSRLSQSRGSNGSDKQRKSAKAMFASLQPKFSGIINQQQIYDYGKRSELEPVIPTKLIEEAEPN